MAAEKRPLIFERISKVIADLKAVSKDKRGPGYKFRGIDDLYNNLHPLMAKHQVFCTPDVISERTEERKSKAGGNLIYRILHIKYTFYTVDGSNVTTTVIGEAMDNSDKASNKAMSVAQKYVFFQIFCIATEDIADPDSEKVEVGPSNKPPAKPKPKPKPKASEPVVFDINNQAHLDRLDKRLSEKDVPPDKHLAIAEALDGKVVSPEIIDIAINKVRSESK